MSNASEIQFSETAAAKAFELKVGIRHDGPASENMFYFQVGSSSNGLQRAKHLKQKLASKSTDLNLQNILNVNSSNSKELSGLINRIES